MEGRDTTRQPCLDLQHSLTRSVRKAAIRPDGESYHRMCHVRRNLSPSLHSSVCTASSARKSQDKACCIMWQRSRVRDIRVVPHSLPSRKRQVRLLSCCSCDFSEVHAECCGPSVHTDLAGHPTAVCLLFTSHVLCRTGYKVLCACSEEEEASGMERWLHGKNLVLLQLLRTPSEQETQHTLHPPEHSPCVQDVQVFTQEPRADLGARLLAAVQHVLRNLADRVPSNCETRKTVAWASVA